MSLFCRRKKTLNWRLSSSRSDFSLIMMLSNNHANCGWDSLNLYFRCYRGRFAWRRGMRVEGWRNMSRSGATFPKTFGKLSWRNQLLLLFFTSTCVSGCGSQQSAAVIDGECPAAGFEINIPLFVEQERHWLLKNYSTIRLLLNSSFLKIRKQLYFQWSPFSPYWPHHGAQIW